jgi:hypothetical protein
MPFDGESNGIFVPFFDRPSGTLLTSWKRGPSRFGLTTRSNRRKPGHRKTGLRVVTLPLPFFASVDSTGLAVRDLQVLIMQELRMLIAASADNEGFS